MKTETPAIDIQEELARLARSYTERLPAELSELRRITSEFTGQPSDRHLLEEVQRRLHRIAGTGGTFGLMTLSLAARDLERRVQQWLSDGLDGVERAERERFAQQVCALSAGQPEAGSQVQVPTPSKPPVQPVHDTSCLWLAEADIELAEDLTRQLRSFNYRVRSFSTIAAMVAEAQASGTHEGPDLVIVDAVLSHHGPDEAALVSLRQVLPAHTPSILISACDDFLCRVRAAQLGAVGYMLKPLDIPRLVTRISSSLEECGASAEKVLIVEDDTTLAEHLRLTLVGAGMDAMVLARPDAIMETLSSYRPELVLMDLHMPEFMGSDLAGVIRQHDAWMTLPIIYLSAEADLEQQIEAMARGADEFLSKPVPTLQLVATVRSRIRRARELCEQVSKDSLTGLLKHGSLKAGAEALVLRARRSGNPVTLAMLDLDHFKSVNDTYGHAVGDQVITSVAMLLRQRLRQSDLIGRYGGEEFVVVLPECSAREAEVVINDIRKRLGSLRFSHEDKTFYCSVSAGLACSADYPEHDAAGLLAVADEALYAAKRGGRNKVVVAEERPAESELVEPRRRVH